MCNKLESKGRYWTRLPVSRTWTLVAPYILGKAQGYKNRRRIPDQRSQSFTQIVGKSPIKSKRYHGFKTRRSKVSGVQVRGFEYPNIRYFTYQIDNIPTWYPEFNQKSPNLKFNKPSITLPSKRRNRVSVDNIPSSNYCSANLIWLYSIL